MRKINYCIECSLDGYISRTDHTFDFLFSEGQHIIDFHNSLVQYDTVLMGRKTYEIGVDSGVINPSLGLTQYVISTSLKETINPAIKIISDNVIDVVKKLKSKPGKDILLSGGGELATSLLSAQLLDNIMLRIIPVLIGSGIPLFTKITKDVSLDLYDHKIYSNRVALNGYHIVYS